MENSATDIKPQARLMLVSLLLAGDWAANKDLKPNLTKAQRQPLIDAGLVEEERRKNRAVFLRLTEKGWVWMQSHIGDPLQIQRNTAASVLDLLLRQVSGLLQRKEIPVAELARPVAVAKSSASPAVSHADEELLKAPVNLDQQIETACLKLAQGERNRRVRLSELRPLLKDVPRSELDEHLLSLGRSGRLQLFRLDNPLEVHAADKDAVLHTPSGEPRHLVYWIGT